MEITPGEFERSEGAGDWRVVFEGAGAFFRVPSIGVGAAFVGAVGGLLGADDGHARVDLRADGVSVRLAAGQFGELTSRELELARAISGLAAERGLVAEPAGVQSVSLTLDALVSAAVMPFWCAVLGYEQVGDEDVMDAHGRGPLIWFQDLDAPRPQRNRLHVDVSVPADQAEARVAAALAAGGVLVSAANAPQHWTLRDAEGNEVDVATWQGR